LAFFGNIGIVLKEKNSLFIYFIYLFFLNNLLNLKYTKKNIYIYIMGIGDWGLGIGDWGLGPIPNPQSPIPNPQSPII